MLWYTYSRLPITKTFKGNRKKFELSGVRVIGSWKEIATLLAESLRSFLDKSGKRKRLPDLSRKIEGHSVRRVEIAGSKEKNSFYCTVNILITFHCRNVKWKLKDTSKHSLNRACVLMFWEIKLFHVRFVTNNIIMIWGETKTTSS